MIAPCGRGLAPWYVDVGMTVSEIMNVVILKSLNCFSNEGDKWRQSDINFLNETTLKININEKFIGERGRINCSLRDSSGFWRWLGIQFVISDK